MELPAGGQVPECATLTVPLDHDDPSVGNLDLRVKRFSAKEPEERIGVLLYNPGGPAAQGTEFLPLVPFTHDLLRRFDLVSWDPREATEESLVYCGEQPSFASVLDPTPESDEENALIEEQFRSLAAGAESTQAICFRTCRVCPPLAMAMLESSPERLACKIL